MRFLSINAFLQLIAILRCEDFSPKEEPMDFIRKQLKEPISKYSTCMELWHKDLIVISFYKNNIVYAQYVLERK